MFLRDLAKRIAQTLKRQIAQSDAEISSFLRPRRPVPIPIPVRLPPKSRLDSIKSRLGTGTLRAHGYRAFSTQRINHAKAVFDALPRYCPGQVSAAVRAIHPSTTLTIPILPALAIPKTGSLSEVIDELDDLIISAPQMLARVRRDVQRLKKSGDFEYALNDHAIDITFHGKEMSLVEAYLSDIGVSSGTITVSSP